MNPLRTWISRRWGSIKHRIRLLFEVLDRSSRYFLATIGIPIRRHFLVLRCAEGSAVSGLFSEFAAVLGALDHYERWRKIYAGLRVDFDEKGLYYEPARGNNWWAYYFEHVELGSEAQATSVVLSDRQHDIFAYGISSLSRARGFALIDRYIRARQYICEKVDSYVSENFGETFVIGVHYRGTDKWEDAPRVAYSEICVAIERVVESVVDGRWKVFVATDEKPFVDYMANRYPDDLLYREMYRSIDGRPIDVVNEDGNYRKGEDAVLDCLLLSRCQYLIRTASNLSLCSTLINPNVPEIALNRER